MNKSLIPKACELLGVTIGEEFNFCGYRKNVMIDEDGYVLEPADSGEWRRSKNFTLADLLRVPHEIRKLPWQPKEGEKYWTFDTNCSRELYVAEDSWYGQGMDLARKKAGWIYRTCEEAEAALPIVARELGVKYAYKKLY